MSGDQGQVRGRYVDYTEVVTFIDDQDRPLSQIEGGRPYIESDLSSACRFLIALQAEDKYSMYQVLRSSEALALLRGVAELALAFGVNAWGADSLSEVLDRLLASSAVEGTEPVRTYVAAGEVPPVGTPTNGDRPS